MSEVTLQINGLSPPVVTDDPNPVFSFWLDGSYVAARLSLSLRGPDGTVIWSIRRNDCINPYLHYEGPPLSPKTSYLAEIVLYDTDGQAVSAKANLKTGFLRQPWQACWIEPVQEPGIREKEASMMEILTPDPSHFGGHTRLKPCRELRKTFICTGQTRQAQLYASAHGVYELLINGRKAGPNRLAPETSAYPEILYYQTYDVTGLIRPGENTIDIRLGDGWWIGRIGFGGDSCQYGDRLGLIMQLDYVDGDGKKQTIGSDETFLCRPSNTEYADLFIGERQNLARSESTVWQNCLLADYPVDNLLAQPIEPVREQAVLQPAAILISPAGELIADFGQVLAGVVRMSVECSETSEIVLDHSEVFDLQGNFYRNIIGRNKDQRDVFVCPAGLSDFQPVMTYHGFRYVRISGIDRQQIKEICAVVLGTPLRETGHFSCSDPKLNQLQHNIRWSTLSNMFSVPTDCPQREKMGWTGDIQVFTKTGCFNFDLANFLEGWLMNLRSEQLPDGEVPMVVPNYPLQDQSQRRRGGGTSSAWGDACVLVPWYLYQHYGDIAILEQNLETMERWLAFVAREAAQSTQQGRSQYLWTSGHHFGDWLIPSLRQQPDGVQKGVDATAEVIASCFYAVTVQAYINILDALIENGHDEHSIMDQRNDFIKLLTKIRTAVRAQYISEDGLIKGDLQGLYVLALYSGVAEGDLAGRVAAQLSDLIEQNNNRLDTGFVSVPYLLDVLDSAGRRDLALKLLFQTESPSWLYMVEQGATTIWENWEAILPDGTVTDSSYNHYALGSVGDWIYRNIGGIAPVAPGYRVIRFQPDIDCGFEHSQCSLRTLFGQVVCNWQWTAEGCTIDLTVPAGCEAELVIRGAKETLAGGRHVRVVNK